MEEQAEEVAVDEIKYDDDNVVMHFTLRGDINSLKHAFDNTDDPGHETVSEKINLRNEVGKTPLETACMLGKDDVVAELIRRGADVNLQTHNGYTPLHVAACWGSRSCVEVLVENGAKLNVRNKHGETARHASVRYNKDECVLYLDWAAAKKTLEDFVAQLREMVSDPEKLQGVKLTKEEKSTVLSACNEKQEWLEGNLEVTANDFLMKKEELERDVEAVTTKVNSPPPNTGSTGKK